ncbi:hypothetical protein P167DRAFT_126465 [Morchella conica CCBAS932]|uniref:Uncharacterized protein n=1 Tax=Morchella conica CCBAS932 TaxID=1392247 RepID=A0A3N4L395_9PEZI|nr:hypothetical protein P167DRAFT_126465 [Morchella conica CCBAS932]
MESNYYYRQERGRGDSRRIESGNLYSIAGFAQQVSLLYDGMAGDLCVDLRIARLRDWLLDYWGLATVGIKTCGFFSALTVKTGRLYSTGEVLFLHRSAPIRVFIP